MTDDIVVRDLATVAHGMLIGVMLGLLMIDFYGRGLRETFMRVERWTTPTGSR